MNNYDREEDKSNNKLSGALLTLDGSKVNTNFQGHEPYAGDDLTHDQIHNDFLFDSSFQGLKEVGENKGCCPHLDDMVIVYIVTGAFLLNLFTTCFGHLLLYKEYMEYYPGAANNSDLLATTLHKSKEQEPNY